MNMQVNLPESTPVHDAALNLTRHAEVRVRQRAIPPLAIELLVRFGSVERAPGGAAKVFFDKPARKRLAAFAGPIDRRAARALGSVCGAERRRARNHRRASPGAHPPPLEDSFPPDSPSTAQQAQDNDGHHLAPFLPLRALPHP